MNGDEMEYLHSESVDERRCSHRQAERLVSAAYRSPPSKACSWPSVSCSQPAISTPLSSASLYICNQQTKTHIYIYIHIYIYRYTTERERERKIYIHINIPAVLEPDLDLLRLDVGEDRAFADELLAAHGAGLGTVMV